jgi:hydroxyacylglutathione hydrolase
MGMEMISVEDFEPIDDSFPDLLFLRVDERVCSTRYLICDRKKGKTMLIDSGDGKDGLDFVPDTVFLTHGHWDHTQGVREEWPEVWIHPAERKTHTHIIIPPNARPLLGQHFDFGAFHFSILPTPGHTPGSMCLLEERSGFLFSGDTLFSGGVPGRTDVGGDEGQMEKSLELLEQVPYTMLCPGHGEMEEKE